MFFICEEITSGKPCNQKCVVSPSAGGVRRCLTCSLHQSIGFGWVWRWSFNVQCLKMFKAYLFDNRNKLVGSAAITGPRNHQWIPSCPAHSRHSRRQKKSCHRPEPNSRACSLRGDAEAPYQVAFRLGSIGIHWFICCWSLKLVESIVVRCGHGFSHIFTKGVYIIIYL